jgi:hypothetical protein
MESTALNVRLSWHAEGDSYGFLYQKNGQSYCWEVRPETRQIVLSLVGRLAANPEVDFDWHDAAHVTSVIRQNVPVAGTLQRVLDDYEEHDEVRESIDDWTMLATMIGVGLLGWWGIWLIARALIFN